MPFIGMWNRLEVMFGEPNVFEKARGCVPFFYYFIVFMVFAQFMRFEQLSHLVPTIFWPIFWLRYVGPVMPYASQLFIFILFFSALAGAVFFRYRAARMITCFGIFQYQAFLVSLLGNEHDMYIPLFVSFLFIFLPDIWKKEVSEDKRRSFVLLFWGAQAYVLLVYTMSGFYKVVSAYQQYMAGHANYFSFDSAALYVSYWMPQYGRPTMLGPFIVEHQLLGWFSLMILLYVLECSIWIAFKPSLHRLWGVALIFFHLSTLLSLGIIFSYNVFFVSLFLINSPFAPVGISVKEMLFDLPIFGVVLRYLYSLLPMRRLI